MDEERARPRSSWLTELDRVRWDQLVDSNAALVWAAVGGNRELFLLAWLRLADRWRGHEPGSFDSLLREVVAEVNKGGCAPGAVIDLDALGRQEGTATP